MFVYVQTHTRARASREDLERKGHFDARQLRAVLEGGDLDLRGLRGVVAGEGVRDAEDVGHGVGRVLDIHHLEELVAEDRGSPEHGPSAGQDQLHLRAPEAVEGAYHREGGGGLRPDSGTQQGDPLPGQYQQSRNMCVVGGLDFHFRKIFANAPQNEEKKFRAICSVNFIFLYLLLAEWSEIFSILRFVSVFGLLFLGFVSFIWCPWKGPRVVARYLRCSLTL